MYYVYVLKKKSNNKLYIGSTYNLEKRLEEHRKGKVFFTKNSDFNLIYYEAYTSEKDARIREKHLKYFGKAYQALKKRIEGAG